MSRIDDYKSELVQTTTCEIELLKRGQFKCANEILKYRREATLRAYIIDCLIEDDDYDEEIVNYIMEQVKESARMIVRNKCIQSYC